MSDKSEAKLMHTKGIVASNKASAKTNNIKAYIDAHITEDLSLDILSKEFCISKSYLSHLYRTHTGLSVFRYIKLKRLMLAKSHYESGLQLTEAALKAGFSDYTTFYKAYRTEYGSSPSKHTSK